MIYQGSNNEYFEVITQNKPSTLLLDGLEVYPLQFVWVKGEQIKLIHEDVIYPVKNNSIFCFTLFNKVEFQNIETARIIKFNREFYCIKDHDKEVSCRGLLFYNTNQLPHFEITPTELEKFETFWQMLQLEIQSKDDLQLEMLQMMLKRFIILCTRMYKANNNIAQLKDQEVDIVRMFHFLVEQHYKSKHTIKEYANLLNKSPKTLSNIFSKISNKSPLQIIHERKLTEAKRLLKYSDKSIKETAYELGFSDIQTFSRFFKKAENTTPSDFKNQFLGKNANSSGMIS